jgi:hypothetical protein
MRIRAEHGGNRGVSRLDRLPRLCGSSRFEVGPDGRALFCKKLRGAAHKPGRPSLFLRERTTDRWREQEHMPTMTSPRTHEAPRPWPCHGSRSAASPVSQRAATEQPSRNAFEAHIPPETRRSCVTSIEFHAWVPRQRGCFCMSNRSGCPPPPSDATRDLCPCWQDAASAPSSERRYIEYMLINIPR